MKCHICNQPWEPTGHWCPRLAETPPAAPVVTREEYERLFRRVAYLEGALMTAQRKSDSAISEIRMAIGELRKAIQRGR